METYDHQASNFSSNSLALNLPEETGRIVDFLTQAVHHDLHRQGGVVGISGGIDSSVVLALCARAFGPQRVTGIIMPEKESSPESAILAQELADVYGVQTVTEDITGALEGLGCYRRRDEAIQRIFPEYRPGWKAKIVLPGNLLERDTLNVFTLVVCDPDGNEMRRRLPLREYYQIVASSNFKQRTRMSMLFYHSELRNYAVIGTSNKNEYDLGFFVKYGDGGMDISPIGHLFKSQVFQLAEYLGVPESIRARPPSTDTYPGGGTQEEFFYRIPFHTLDTIWHGYELGIRPVEIAQCLGLEEEQVQRVVDDITRKHRTTQYLRQTPIPLSS